jgi:serine/threonine-protein kinase
MSETLEPGQRFGRYELVCSAGQGGMASVWLARLVGTRGFHKPVAVKTLLPSVREDADAERMFQSEAAHASRIRHPNVVEILDLGEEGGALFLVMEWIHGEPLSTVITRASKRGGVPLGIAVRIGAQVCAGLHAAHELTDEEGKPLGLVHRDVSPQNVLVGFNGMVKLVDFGIAKATAEATHLTEMGVVRGKVAYMAPEQMRFEKLDRRTDVFAVGILLYVLTTGRHPFKRDERNETVRAICSEDPPEAPTRFLPGYPERLERVVLKALAKNPDERYATAQELGEDLMRTIPPSRGTSQEELQKFTAELMPDRLAYHQDLIRRALGVQGLGPSPSGAPRTAHSSSTLRAVSVSDPASPSEGPVRAEPAEGAPAPERQLAVTLRPRSRKSTTVLALAAGALLGAVVLAAVTGARKSAETSGAASATHSAPSPANVAPRNVEPEHAPVPLVAPDAGARASAPVGTHPPATEKVEPSNGAKVPRTPVRRAGAKPPASPVTGLKDPYATK